MLGCAFNCQTRDCSHIDNEGSSMSYSLAFYRYISTHFIDKMFANTQSQPGTLAIDSLIVANHIELDEQFFNVFWFNTSSIILYDDLKGNIIIEILFILLKFSWNYKVLGRLLDNFREIICAVLLHLSNNLINVTRINNFLRKFNSMWLNLNCNLSIIWSKFKCICKEVQEYLCVPPFITINVLEEYFNIRINDKLREYVFTFRHILNISYCVLYCLCQIKEFIAQLKFIVFQLSKVKKIIYMFVQYL